jgi:acetoin utilization deacetylase AcuC-like enzyme
VLEAVHDSTWLDLLEDLDARGGGRIDLDTAMSRGSLDAAKRGSQGTIDAATKVLDGAWEAGFVLMRPPGHHATRFRGRSMGFCLTNHVAVAARWALDAGRASRVLVVDYDAHHGNGTQDIFYADPRVLYVSLHQYPWYPGTGDATEVGEGEGAGFTLNIPLPAGTAEDGYDRAFTELVEPAAHGFEPDLVLVSAGFDAHHLDPLCMMRLTAGAFFRLARRLAGLGAGPVCVLEGGYDLDAIGWSAAATLAALLGDAVPAGLPEAEVDGLPGVDDAHEWVERAIMVRRSVRRSLKRGAEGPIP